MNRAMDRAAKDKALLKQLHRRLKKCRVFPTHTCPASRHVQMMGEYLPKKGGYQMLTDEPEHCAISLLSVVASLWEARIELAKLKCTRP